MNAFHRLLPKGNMRDENEKRIWKAIQENDIESMKEISNLVDCHLGPEDIPILSAALLKRDIDMIKYLLDIGCDTRKVDKDGWSVWDMLFWERSESSDDEKNRLQIADILLTTYSNGIEAIFLKADKYKMTPFLIVCQWGFDAIVLRFLDLIDKDSISTEHVIGQRGDNVFHFLFHRYRRFLPPTSFETVRALIDKFSNFLQLINAKNRYGDTPLHNFFMGNKNENREMVDLANLFFQCGASADLQDGRGATYLHLAIGTGNVSLIEILLRVGCRTDVFYNESPLFSLLKNKPTNFISIIERLLAFGYDLQKELFLYTIDKRPIEFSSPEYVERRDTSNMDQDILQQLQELRRSNKMLSLQRQCRNTIRRHLKAKADEVIESLTCIPDRIKSYLLVNNEEPLLEIRE